MKLSEELQWRGLVQDHTFKKLEQLDNHKLTFYIGFDASTSSQTIGNLAPLMTCRVLLRHGYKAIILAGGATSLIGDPGGKDKERQLQSEETIASNVNNAKKQISSILKGYQFELVNNLDWLGKLTLIPYLRDIGKHFSMTPLIQRDYIAQRLGEDGAGISYTEFSYTLLQGIDYLHLFDNYDCRLQLGGSDQWGNCLSGVDLIRRARSQEAHVITLPLIIDKTTGRKFGKTEAGAVWLDPTQTSPYSFYQFWFNSGDEAVEDYLKLFTDLDKPAVDKLMTEHRHDASQRQAQKQLAGLVTELVHGQQARLSVEALSDLVFGKGQVEITSAVKDMILTELPNVKVQQLDRLDLAQTLVELGLASSKSQARQFLADGAIRTADGQAIDLETNLADYSKNGLIIVKRGKNQLAVIQSS